MSLSDHTRAQAMAFGPAQPAQPGPEAELLRTAEERAGLSGQLDARLRGFPAEGPG